MKIQRVFLIKPAYKKSHYRYSDLPAGLGYISHALDKNGIDNIVFDMYHNENVDNLLRAIEDYRPDLIGLSLMSFKFLDHYKLIDSIKTRFPSVLIVAGGPHVSMMRESVLAKCLSIDYGITLEGDNTIIELCNNNANPHEIKGLLYRHGDKILYTGDRPFIDDLDKVGFPTYARFDLKKYDFITIITSRGCPFHCIYCPVLYTIGNRWRYRSATSVGDELEYWYQKGYRRFEFGDDNFTLKQERVFEICDQIEKRKFAGIKIGLGNGIRADRVTKDMLLRMKEVGFSYIAFGVEAGNNKILKNINKGETIDQIETGIKWATEIGFPVNLFFLLGSPGETEEDVRDSVDLALRYPVENVRFYNILPFPQSKLYQWVLENNLFLRDPEQHLNDGSHWVFSPLFETKELPQADRIRLLQWANAVTLKHTYQVVRRRLSAEYREKGIPGPFAPLAAYLAQLIYIRWKFGQTRIGKRIELLFRRDM